MRKLGWIAAIGVMALGTALNAQEVQVRPGTTSVTATATSAPPAPTQAPVAVTPPVPSSHQQWMYEQALRNEKSPQAAVRRKAEFETWQRQQRLAASRWYGVSNSRPYTNPFPFSSMDYGPHWGSNTGSQFMWSGNQNGPQTLNVMPPWGGWW